MWYDTTIQQAEGGGQRAKIKVERRSIKNWSFEVLILMAHYRPAPPLDIPLIMLAVMPPRHASRYACLGVMETR